MRHDRDDILIPGDVWTQFLAQETQLDAESPGPVTLSAVVAEIRRMVAEAGGA